MVQCSRLKVDYSLPLTSEILLGERGWNGAGLNVECFIQSQRPNETLKILLGLDQNLNAVFEISDPKSAYLNSLVNFLTEINFIHLKGEILNQESKLVLSQKPDGIFL